PVRLRTRRGWDTGAGRSITSGSAARNHAAGGCHAGSIRAVRTREHLLPRGGHLRPDRTRYTEVVTPLLAIGPDRLDVERIAAALEGPLGGDASTGPGHDGAVVTFLGLVRTHNVGRSVRYLEYEAYEPLALKAFARIDAEIHERWPSARLALHHRTGRLEIGEASVAIVVRSPHR